MDRSEAGGFIPGNLPPVLLRAASAEDVR